MSGHSANLLHLAVTSLSNKVLSPFSSSSVSGLGSPNPPEDIPPEYIMGVRPWDLVYRKAADTPCGEWKGAALPLVPKSLQGKSAGPPAAQLCAAVSC